MQCSSFIFILILFFSVSSVAAKWKPLGEKALSLKVGIGASTLGVDIERKESDLKRINYEPHAPTHTFLSASYDWLGFTVQAVNPIATADQDLKGKTTGQDWQFRFNFEKVSFEFFYQNYQGYYVENTSEFQSQPSGTPYLQNPNMKTEHFGLNFLWNVNPDDFSLSAAMDQSAVQTQSGWAWLLGSSLHGARFTSSESLVPTVVAGQYGEIENVRSARLYSALLGGGLGGSYVPADNWFISGAMLVYYGLELQRLEVLGSADQEKSMMTSKAHLKVGFGYCGSHWMSGMTLQGDSSNYTITNAGVSFSSMQYAVFLGRRFDL